MKMEIFCVSEERVPYSAERAKYLKEKKGRSRRRVGRGWQESEWGEQEVRRRGERETEGGKKGEEELILAKC